MYPSILIVSPQRGLGAQTVARAFSNSFGNYFRIGIAEPLSHYDIRAFFTENLLNESTTYYITGCEKMSLFNQSIIHKVIVENVIDVPNAFIRKLDPVYFQNPIIILSAVATDRIAPELLRVVKVHLRLHRLNSEQIAKMLKMKSDYWGFSASESCLEYIAEEARGNPGRAARLWEMASEIMKHEGKRKLDISHSRKARFLSVDEYAGGK